MSPQPTGRSFLDQQRAKPPAAPKTVNIIGVDPDLNEGGIAWMAATIIPSLPPRIDHVHAITLKIPQTAKEPIERAMSAATFMAQWVDRYAAFTNAYIIIEGQRVYPDPDANRAKMVAQSNDLIMLAVISGACFEAARRAFDQRIVLPQTWKGQASKRANNAHTTHALERAGAKVSFFASQGMDTVPASPSNHALDAAGMCMYAVDLLSRQMW